MKNKLVFFLITCFFLNSSYAVEVSKKCSVYENIKGSKLGQVIYSILSEDRIQEIYGAEWVLMEGQKEDTLGVKSEEESVFKYLNTNKNIYGLPTNKLPNASGLFLRVSSNSKKLCDRKKNHNPNENDCSGNPSKQTIGSYQRDTFENHSHVLRGKERNVSPGTGRRAHIYSRDYKATTFASGDAETRPKNLTVNAFVKIKLKCLDDDSTYKVASETAAELKELKSQIDCSNKNQFKKNDSPEASLEKLNKLWSAGLKNKVGDTRIDFEDNFENGKRIGTLNQYLAGEKTWSLACVMQTVNSIISILTYHDEFIDGKKGSNGFKFDYQDALKSYLIQEFPLYPSRFDLLNENKKIVQ